MAPLPDSWLNNPPIRERGNLRPLATWGNDGELNKRIVHALQEKNRQFNASGYEWQFGREQEFELVPRQNIDEDSTARKDFTEQKRESIKAAWVKANPGKVTARELEAQRHRIDTFNLKELFMAELQLQLQDILMPRFAERFYDAQPGVFEVSTKPVDPAEDVKQFHLLQHTMRQLADEYDYIISYRKRDISFVCKDRETGKSLFDARPGHQDPRGLQVANGLLRMAYDAAPAFVRMRHDSHYENGDQYTIGICRDNKLRWRDIDGKGLAIMELRDDQNPLAQEHPALENLLILAGAQYGLHYNRDQHYKDNVSKAEYSSKRIFTSGEHEHFFTKEILNLASIGANGQLLFDNTMRLRRDINKYRPFLEKELCLKPDAAVIDIKRGFKSLQLNESQTALGNPEVLSAISTDASKTEKALAGISFGKEVHRIRNKDGYTVALSDINTGEPFYPGEDDKQRYVHFMAQSELLKRTLNRTLFRDIMSAYADMLGMEPPAVSEGPRRSSP